MNTDHAIGRLDKVLFANAASKAKVMEIASGQQMFASDEALAVLLFGAPGTGKTTVAKLMADSLRSQGPVASDGEAFHWIHCQGGVEGVTQLQQLQEQVARTVREGSNRRDCYVLDEIDRLNEQAQSILLSLCGHQCACFLMTAHALDQVSEALTQRSECIEMAEVPPPLLMPWVRAISRELGHELGDTRLFSAILRCRGRLGRIISSLEMEADLLHVEAGAEEH